MDFSSGNSGNTLRAAVLKRGYGCQQEGVYCKYLGEDVTPEVFEIIPDGYVMESLSPFPRTPSLLKRIEEKLDLYVWSRPPLTNSLDVPWQERLAEYGITIPSWVADYNATACLVHGDPTASNTLIRGTGLIICDPRPPRDYIPQWRETDMGRILQSFLGWERAAYGWDVQFEPPHFMHYPKYASQALFWCGAAAARIEHLEKSRVEQRQSVLDWCQRIREVCSV